MFALLALWLAWLDIQRKQKRIASYILSLACGSALVFYLALFGCFRI